MFAPEGIYPPAGMFTPAHLISLFICVFLIIVAIYSSRNISQKRLYKNTFIIAVFITICEIVKITYKFAINKISFYNFNNWVPLYYCSIFIYASWFALSKNDHLKKLGESFLSCGAITGGMAFLLFPTTSLMMVPIFHFLSLHSMIYHSLMIYLGFMYIYKGLFFKKTSFKYYAICFAIFLIPSLLINLLTDSNMMLLAKPFNFPFDIVNKIYNFAPWLYPVLASLVYLFGPYIVSYFIDFLLNKTRNTDQRKECIKNTSIKNA